MSDIDKLRPAMGTETDRPHLMRAHAVLLEGVRWLAGSDGKVLAALRSDETVDPLPEGWVHTRTEFEDVLRPRGGDKRFIVTRGDLAAWLELPAPVDCTTCKRKGQVEHRCSECSEKHTVKCKECKGTGLITANAWGTINGILVSKARVQQAVASCPEDVELVDVFLWTSMDTIRFSCEGWVGVVMPAERGIEPLSSDSLPLLPVLESRVP